MISRKFSQATAGISRILFLGDSITQGGDYVTDVACGLLAAGFTGEILSLGLSSESATDLSPAENEDHLRKHGFGRPLLSQRLGRVLGAVKADLVFACYGMNDGGGLPRGEAGVARFGEAMARLRQAAFDSGAKHVALCTPPVSDPKHGPENENRFGALVDFTAWLLEKRMHGWEIVDIHNRMLARLFVGRTHDASFTLASDGVHPGREGHFLMAGAILQQYFGIDPAGKKSSDEFFPKDGPALRALVDERRKTLFAGWMTRLGHTRPGVPGGPGAEPGPGMDAMEQKLRELDGRIRGLAGLSS